MKAAMILSMLAFLGCSTTPAQFAPAKLTRAYPPRTSPEKIELFRTQTPTKKFFEIGSVNECCGGETNYLINKLREAASENGGDALIGLDISATGGASASVIRYQDTPK